MKKILLPLLIASSAAHSADFFFKTESLSPDLYYGDPLYAAYSKACGDFADLEIDIKRLNTNRAAINQTVNADIPDAQAVKQYLQDTLQPIIDDLKSGKLEPSATFCSRAWQYTPSHYGHYKNLKQITLDYFEYSGGAHGLYGSTWYVFDDNDRRLTLADLLEKDAEPFYQLLEKTYIAQSGNDPQKNSDPIDQGWYKAVRETADNFYFDHDALVISYVPYAIGPYSEGQIELRLPYSELKGIVKAAYLP